MHATPDPTGTTELYPVCLTRSVQQYAVFLQKPARQGYRHEGAVA